MHYIHRSFSAKRALELVALLRKITCDLWQPMSLRHPLRIHRQLHSTNSNCICINQYYICTHSSISRGNWRGLAEIPYIYVGGMLIPHVRLCVISYTHTHRDTHTHTCAHIHTWFLFLEGSPKYYTRAVFGC